MKISTVAHIPVPTSPSVYFTRPSPPAVTETDRLATLVRHLDEEGWLRAADLAEKLGVSPRTVYRDVQRLHAAGVPLRAAPGRGYRLPEGSMLPPVLLRADEAALLLAGAEHAEAHADARLRTAAQSARQKIEAVLPPGAAAGAQRLREALQTAPATLFETPDARRTFETVRDAIESSRGLRFVLDGRTVTCYPYALARRSGAWMLIGRDAARQGVTTFRVDRLLAPELLSERFDRPAVYASAPVTAARDVEVRVFFDAEAARWLDAHPVQHLETLEATSGGAIATLYVQRVEEVIPWLLSWGAHARVLDPPALAQRLRQEATRIAQAYPPEAPGLFG